MNLKTAAHRDQNKKVCENILYNMLSRWDGILFSNYI